VAFCGERILVFAVDVVFARDPLGGVAHVLILNRAPQAIVDRAVYHLGVAKPVAEPRFAQQVGSQVHVFHAAGDIA